MTDNTTLGGDFDYENLLRRARESVAQTQVLSSRLAMVNEISARLNSTFDLDEILSVIGDQGKWLLDFEHCSVCLRTEAGWELRTLFGTTGIAQPEKPETDDSIGYTIRTGHPRLILNNKGGGVFARFASQLIVPLKSEQAVIGTLNFVVTRPQVFTVEDLRIAYLIAFQLANAIRNAERYHELRRTQEELRRYSEELEVRNEELNAYNHIIAHDLKTPLNAIYGYASLLQIIEPHEFVDEGAGYVKQILNAAQAMNAMIDQLLWLAKTQNVPVTEVDVDPLVRRMVQRFEHQLTATGIRLEIEPGIPPALGHEAWIEEIFANLIGNAIKYMNDSADPYIRVRGANKGQVCVYEVEDNGIGIDKEHLPNVFQLFTRANQTSSEGHGLGLSIVARLVKRLGGEVGVKSKPRKGSTFWFTLPAVPGTT